MKWRFCSYSYIGNWFLIFPDHGPTSWATSFAGWMVRDNRWQSHKCHRGCANGLDWTFAERSSLALIWKRCKERPAGESWIENWFLLAWIFLQLRRWVQFHGTLSGVVRHFNSRDFATALRGLGELLAETARSTQAHSRNTMKFQCSAAVGTREPDEVKWSTGGFRLCYSSDVSPGVGSPMLRSLAAACTCHQVGRDKVIPGMSLPKLMQFLSTSQIWQLV